MSLVSGLIPNLIGGVSQQPPIVRLPSQSDGELNSFPSVTGFQKKRPGSRHLARIVSGRITDVETHTINRDAVEQYIVLFTPGDLRVLTREGRELQVNFPQGKAYLPTQNLSQALRCLTISDHTFIVNTGRKVEMEEELSPARHPEALVFVKQASYATTYTVRLDGQVCTHQTYKDDNRRASDGLEFKSENGFNLSDTQGLEAVRYKLSSSVIAADLTAKINALGPYTAVTVNSAVWVRRTDNGPFNVKVEDSRSNTHLSVATDSVQKFSDLPAVAPEGYVCEIAGDASSNFDNYFVRFRTLSAGDSFGQGLWEETVKPGVPFRLKGSTMPHALVREADGTFVFKPLEWTDRLCGDEESVPLPSFVGRRINSVFLYRNRLSFLAQENVIMSETGRFYNFFATTATTLVDSDPIDVAASGDTRVPSLNHAVSFPEGLILFSESTQFKLEHPSDLLSMSTVAVRPLTEYRAAGQVLPVAAGRGIFFASPRGAYTDIREYIVRDDSSPDAPKTNAHAPEFIPGDVTKLAVSPNEDLLLALSATNRRQISVYKYLWSNNEKLQSAWTKWEFGGEALSAAFHDTEISLIMQYEDGLYLETLNVQPGFKDEGCPFEYALDRKTAEDSLTVLAYSAADDLTSFMLPYPVPEGAEPVIVTRQGGAEPPGTVHEVVRVNGQWVWARGDLGKEKFLTGLAFEFQHDFSPMFLRREDGSPAAVGGRLQIRNLKITYADTGYFEVLVSPLYRESSRHVFTGRDFGYGPADKEILTPSGGRFTVPVLSRSDQVKVGIRSRSFLPCQFVNAEWEGYYHNRSRTIS